MIEKLNHQSFANCLNTDFHVLTGAEPLVLRLVSTVEKTDQPSLEHFALTLVGPLTPWLPQQTCTLDHPRLGQFAVFLVPLGPEGAGMRYEVVFNRFREQPADPA